jgi:hypothetical protein
MLGPEELLACHAVPGTGHARRRVGPSGGAVAGGERPAGVFGGCVDTDNAPFIRTYHSVEPPDFAGPTKLVATPVLGGLHHTYRRVAA